MDERKRVKQMAQLDQASKLLSDTMPPMLGKFFLALVASGFTEAQALLLTSTTLKTLLSNAKD